MSASRIEAFLAKAGLTEREIEALEKIDLVGLEMLAESLKHKRAGRQ